MALDLVSLGCLLTLPLLAGIAVVMVVLFAAPLEARMLLREWAVWQERTTVYHLYW